MDRRPDNENKKMAVRKEYKKNDLVTVTIEDMGHDGEGLGKIEGYPLFIKDAVIGDVVEASIMKTKKNYGYAKLRKVVTPSSFRVTPRCVFHRQCGGCQLQALRYDRQLVFKQNKIRNNLIRLGGFTPEMIDQVMEPIVGMDESINVINEARNEAINEARNETINEARNETINKAKNETINKVRNEMINEAMYKTVGEGAYRYRNKAQFPVGTDKEGQPVVGFYAGRTHDIIANTDCCLGVTENRDILEIILAYMKKNKIAPYDERTGTGLIRHILIRKGFSGGELMVCLIINSTVSQQWAAILPMLPELVDALVKVKGMASISVNLNAEQTNVVMGKEVRIIWGKESITDTLHERNPEQNFAMTGREITFQISPLSFYQINPVQTEKLYSLVLDYAELDGHETVWDIYCGIGTISLFLAGKAGKVYGVESVPEAIRDARTNAVNNKIGNAVFMVGKAEEVLIEKYEKEGIAAEVMVVDPPRKGCDRAVLETMIRIKPRRIIYVSCDSATLARDLRILCDGGYELRRVRGVDQFGQTVHVETVALLSKLKSAESIEVKIELDEMDLTTAESKATYAEVRQYVLENAGFKVLQLYVAQVKRKHGLIERVNYNLGDGKAKVPKVPLEKEQAIEEALRYFKMI